MGKMIVLNHKMNLEYDEVYEYIDGINKIETDNNLVICPSNIYLENFINTCTWGIGSQNVYYKEDGDYTGEVSTLQLKSLGIEYCIVGHYERRKIFKESIKLVKKKLNACLDSNIIPIVCFGSNGNEDSIKDIASDKNQAIIVYCKSGNRSNQALTLLEDLGYTEVYDLGAMSNWEE